MSDKNYILRSVSLLIVFLFFQGKITAQSTENMTLLSQWNHNPTDASFYNDLWGFVDEEGNEYAVVGSRSTIHFLDVTTPESPVLLDEFFEDDWSESRDFKRYGDYIYAVASEGNSGLQVFDMSALPGGSILKTGEDNTHFSTCKNIFIDHARTRMYAAGTDTRTDGLLVFDLSNPSAPLLLADVPLPRGEVRQFHVRHNIAYCVHTTGEMFAYDFQNLINPDVTFYANSPGQMSTSYLDESGRVLVYADDNQPLGLFYVGEMFYAPLPVVSTFHAPLLAPTHTNNLVSNIYIVGDHIFVAYYEDGVVVFDMNNTGNVIRTAYFDTYENSSYNGALGCRDIYPFFPSGNILALDMLNGLHILSLDIEINNSCNNGLQNENETGVDCGGECAPCPYPTCNDGIQNGTETGVDCGGDCLPCCLPAGTLCDDGNPETVDDIEDGNCNCEGGIDVGGSCFDGIQNGSETDVDCGGANCPPCESCISYGNNTDYEYIDRVVFNTINNFSGDNGGYADFSDSILTTVNLGETYEIRLQPKVSSVSTQFWRVWIDVNLDGDFLGEEELVFEGSNGIEVVGEVTIPESVAGAFPKMRVQMRYNYYPSDGCSIFLNGEVEDYALIVQGVVTCDDGLQNGDEQDVDCGGTFCEPCCPYEGTLCDDGNSLTYNDIEDGNCNCIGTDCPSAGTICDDNNPMTENDVFDEYCVCKGRPIPTCDDNIQNGNETGTDCGSDCVPCFYCDSYGQNSDNEYIAQVIFNTLNHPSGNDGGYGDFTDLSTSILRNSVYTLSLTPAFSGTVDKVYWRVWIDFTRDGDFLDAGEMIYEGYGENTLTENIIIPTSVPQGQTRMRVQMRKENYSRDGCAIYTTGEVEDYTVNVE